MTTPSEQEDGRGAKEKSSFADVVNSAVEAMTKDKKGNYVLPDGLSEEVRFAATAEKRRRDTQADFTRTRQQNKALEEEKALLLRKVTGSTRVELSPQQAEELDELKFSDPEAWRKRMNELETAARTRVSTEVDEELKQVSKSSLEQEELERRKQVLDDFNRSHAGSEITQEVVDNDIPPRLKRRLETGEVTFEGFLSECHDYLHTGKVVKQDKVPGGPNLSRAGGGSAPDKNAVKEDIITSYAKETY